MKTYFVSDAHLGSWAFKDIRANEVRLVRWMDSIQSDCEALYLMGDIIDFWFEYKTVVPRGFTRFFGKVAEFTDRGIPVYWFSGNHDIWLFDYVQQELGVTVHYKPLETRIHGKMFFLAHGDGLGDPSFSFGLLQRIFHSKINQTLFGMLHPNIALWFGLKWARNSRLKRGSEPERYLGEEKEYMVQFAKAHSKTGGDNAPDFYVFGHRHILLDLMISSKSRIIILGDWVELFSYGVFDGTNFSLEIFEA
jgi:UDP-2,3-diacylglucosamine hydrolase